VLASHRITLDGGFAIVYGKDYGCWRALRLQRSRARDTGSWLEGRAERRFLKGRSQPAVEVRATEDEPVSKVAPE